MKLSQYFLPTLREEPAEAELVSHRLMLRAGMIRQVASGLYTWLPLGWRVLQRVTDVVRDEMQQVGALEMTMPMVQPAELWQNSARWDKYGRELLRFVDRHDRDFCLGPTHEEVVTELVKQTVRSYKHLPLTVFQIQTKFRDEIRPRFGVMRAREFLMKDAYSFHLSLDDLNKTYHAMRGAYQNIFKRLGLDYRVVLADAGQIGGHASEEFHVLAESGEDELLYSESGDYAANVEQAVVVSPTTSIDEAAFLPVEATTVSGDDLVEICASLSVDLSHSLRVAFYVGKAGDDVAVVCRGDHQINPLKLAKSPLLDLPLSQVSEKYYQEKQGFLPMYADLSIFDGPILVDQSAAVMTNLLGGGQGHAQMKKNLNWQRDIAITQVADLRLAQAGDANPAGSGELKMARGIEVGHIFQLGDQYSDKMQCHVLNESGKAQTLQMGCYGIGVSRIVAACIEQHHDARGIIWPAAMAPFDVVLVPLNAHKSTRVQAAATQMYDAMRAVGIDVLWDDRKERPGVQFSDADLIGVPHRLVISERGLSANTIEYQKRTADESQAWSTEDWLSQLQAQLAAG